MVHGVPWCTHVYGVPPGVWCMVYQLVHGAGCTMVYTRAWCTTLDGEWYLVVVVLGGLLKAVVLPVVRMTVQYVTG